MGLRDYATFLSEASALGPRFRLTYERNTDTYTKKTSMSGKFEQLLPNGKWLTYLQWGGGLGSAGLMEVTREAPFVRCSGAGTARRCGDRIAGRGG